MYAFCKTKKNCILSKVVFKSLDFISLVSKKSLLKKKLLLNTVKCCMKLKKTTRFIKAAV